MVGGREHADDSMSNQEMLSCVNKLPKYEYISTVNYQFIRISSLEIRAIKQAMVGKSREKQSNNARKQYLEPTILIRVTRRNYGAPERKLC